MNTAITDVDITALLQPRQGYLWKLGGGQDTGSKCACAGNEKAAFSACSLRT